MDLMVHIHTFHIYCLHMCGNAISGNRVLSAHGQFAQMRVLIRLFIGTSASSLYKNM